MYLGETLVPYANLDPLKAVLPLRLGETQLPTDPVGVGGIRLGGLERRMRERWQTVSRLWETEKRPVNRLNLLGRLDFHRELSSQLEWSRAPGERPVRVVYGGWGTPTAALLDDDNAIVDYKLFWITCRDTKEAHYLLAIINSDTLYELVKPLMSKGQFGARDLQKHLWKLPTPEFDAGKPLHVTVSEAGAAAAAGTKARLDELRKKRGDKLTVTIARREIRKWLRESAEGKAVERTVGEFLEKNVDAHSSS